MKNLQNLYNETKITLSEISKITGFSVSTISRYVNGNVKSINYKYYDPIYKTLENHNKDVNKTDVNNTVLNNVDIQILKSQMNCNTVSKPVSTSVASTSTYNPIKKPQRGDLFYVKNTTSTGGEVWGSRLAVIVSSNKLNQIMPTVEIVYVTSKPKENLPTHCTISTDRELSVCLAEQISSVSKTRLGKFIGVVTDVEMMVIEKSMRSSLDLKMPVVNENKTLDYVILQSERNFYKNFYEQTMKIQMAQAESYAFRNK